MVYADYRFIWRNFKEHMERDARKAGHFVKENIVRKIDCQDVDLQVLYALLTSSLLIMYAPEIWACLLALAFMVYVVYWVMNYDGVVIYL